MATGSIVVVGCIVAAQYEPKAPKNSRIGDVPIGGMSADQVAFRVRTWWQGERQKQVTFGLKGNSDHLTASLADMGVTLDERATVRQVAFDGCWDAARKLVSGESQSQRYEPVFKTESANLSALRKFVEDRVPEREPAHVFYRSGALERQPEVAGFKLDESKVAKRVVEAYRKGDDVDLPVITDAKKVPDEDLGKIVEVVSEFTTHFSEGKASRASNIRVAARRINGLVLAPGEQFSFNRTVGRRTAATGFKEAGVYKDGKHDVDFGGGICQVSTTLYNAALFANLSIKKRTNHSMPVPYVPLGRDATVDYGSADLVVENNTEAPIAITSSVSGGTITFAILGKKDPSLSVKLVAGPASSWDPGEKRELNPSLPAGTERVVEKGTMGRSISTYRVVYKDGVEVKREPLGQSYYRGGKRVIAVGTAAAPTPLDSPSDPSQAPSTGNSAVLTSGH